MELSTERSSLSELSHALRDLRVLCIFNGGIVQRGGQVWSSRYMGNFVTEMGGLAGETCCCGWSDTNDDPLAQTRLTGIPRVRALGLPPFQGSPPRRLINGVSALATLAREVSHADFAYVFWPGRLSAITTRLCRALGTPYGIYLRGERISSGHAFATAFCHARFVLAAGQTLRTAASVYCRDVEDVTPMTALRPGHVIPPRPPRRSAPWRLLHVGRIEERKGVLDLLAAISHLDDWGLPVELTMAGHCRDVAGLLRHVPANVARRVHLIGPVPRFDDLAQLYREADAFVLASHDEGFPRVLYEAMAFGVPIVTTFVGSIAGVMKDRENCLQIDVRNPTDVAEKIRHLFESPELQSHIAWSSHRDITALMKTWQRSHAVQLAERLRDALDKRQP
jgi:glycosyltransferase involved in cell wall biosynthesis